MIIGNTLTEIGDVLYINTSMSFISNYITLNDYIDNTVGETLNRKFDKKFRVSQDGIAYTDWLELNNTNISSIQGNVYNNLIFIQYRYERTGTDSTGTLEFVSVTINATAPAITYSDAIISKTIFKGLSVGNFQTMQLASNLLKKLFKKGIVPEYVERETEDDEDYINYWSAITIYLSMFVTYMSNFENMYVQRDILMEYVKQNGLYINQNKELLSDLQYLIENLYDEHRKRGTKQVFLRKGTKNLDDTKTQVNGEILRLLCVEVCEEFLYTIKKPGLCIGKSSPMCKSTINDKMLTKRFEETNIVQDITKYPKFGSTNIINDNGKIKITTQGSLVKTGIGYENFNSNSLIPDNGFLITPYLDYELCVKFYVDSIASDSKITLGVNVFDCYGNKYTLRDKNNVVNNLFIQDFKIAQINNEYVFRGTIININESFSNQKISKSTNFSDNSTNLRFNNVNITKIVPFIEVKSNNNANFYITDIQIRLLKHNKSFGFLNKQNVLEIFSKNNSQLEKLDVYNKIRQDLIPYSINFDDKNLNLYN